MATEIPANEQKNHQRITLLVLIILLLLRIPYVILVTYLMPVEDQRGGAVYEVGTYLLIAILIWWERSQLAKFHMDMLALVFILVFRPLQTLILNHWKVDSPLTFPNPAALIIWGISLGLILLLWRSGFKPKRIQNIDLAWLGIGLFAGLVFSILENPKPFQSSFTNSHLPSTRFLSMLASTGTIFFYHAGFAAVNEESLFRGFLWGSLRERKWREVWIWLFQAALFTCAHVYFAGQYPLLFWIYIPLAALLLGWLAWCSRSIAGSILAHAMINASTYIVALRLFLVLLRLFR